MFQARLHILSRKLIGKIKVKRKASVVLPCINLSTIKSVMSGILNLTIVSFYTIAIAIKSLTAESTGTPTVLSRNLTFNFPFLVVS